MRSGHTNQCINSWNKPLLADIEEQLERVVIVVEPGHLLSQRNAPLLMAHVDLAFTLVHTQPVHTRNGN